MEAPPTDVQHFEAIILPSGDSRTLRIGVSQQPAIREVLLPPDPDLS